MPLLLTSSFSSPSLPLQEGLRSLPAFGQAMLSGHGFKCHQKKKEAEKSTLPSQAVKGLLLPREVNGTFAIASGKGRAGP